MTHPRGHLLHAALFLAAWTCAPLARADGSVWRRAENPRLAAAEEAVAAVRVLEDRAPSHPPESESPARPSAPDWERARSLARVLEERDAATSDLPALRHALVRNLYRLHQHDGDAGHLREAMRHLAWLVGQPQLPTQLRGSAWWDLATSLALLGDRGAEIDAVLAALQLEPNPLLRSKLHSKLGGARMWAGDPRGAIRDFERALAVLSSDELPWMATALWGLAVALDRSGEFERALETAGRAEGYDPTHALLREPHVFFLPAYDATWCEALASWASARRNPNRLARIDSLADVARHWRTFLVKSAPTSRYRALAEVRLAQSQRESVDESPP